MSTTTTKEKILDAATELVSEKGYLGATTREIAREAGVTELTLFRHYGSKERLFEAILAQHTFLPRMKELLPEMEALPYEEALRLLATRFLLSLKQRKCMVKIMHSEVSRCPGKIRKLYAGSLEDMQSTLGSYFSGLRKKGVVRDIAPPLAARMFLSVFFSYFRTEEIMLGRDITKNGRMEKPVRDFVDIFLHGTINRRDHS